MTKLEKFKQVCRKYLVIKDDSYIDIIFGVIFCNRLDSKPVWLYLVGPPSSGKTEILQALTGSTEIYPISKLKVNSLISGFRGKKGGDPSLLPHLNNKVLIIKDFTAMLTMRHEVLHEILGQLRDAYDGTARNCYGTGDNILYTSKFGIIAAVTNILDKHRGSLAELGERFITYRMPDVENWEEYKRCLKAMGDHSVEEQEQQLTQAAQRVIEKDPPVAFLPKPYKRMLLEVAQVVAKARCEVDRDRYTREPEIPKPEIATRLSKQLGDIAIGIAMARSKHTVTKAEVRLVQRMAVHSLTDKRITLIKAMLVHYPEYVEVSELTEVLYFTDVTIHRWLADLLLLNLVERRTILKGKMQETYQFRLKNGKLLKRVLADCL